MRKNGHLQIVMMLQDALDCSDDEEESGMILIDAENTNNINNTKSVSEKWAQREGYKQAQYWIASHFYFADFHASQPTRIRGIEFRTKNSVVMQHKQDYVDKNGSIDGYELPKKWIKPGTGTNLFLFLMLYLYFVTSVCFVCFVCV